VLQPGESQPPEDPEREGRSPFGYVAAALAGALIVGLVTLISQTGGKDDSRTPASASGKPGSAGPKQTNKPSASASSTPVLRWDFTRGIPPEWTRVGAVRPTAQGLQVTTTRTAGYQLYSLSHKLAPGRYEVRARVVLRSGGIGIGLVNVATQRFVINEAYTANGDGRGPLSTTGAFRLKVPARVSVVLSNVFPPGTPAPSSRWDVRQLSLWREKGGRGA
jgi:hypothetical protein